ncbi:unnamed protein product [Discula destructiva]
MANGLNKLERLFSTKKKSAPIRHTAEPDVYGSVPSTPTAHLQELTQMPLEKPELPPSFPQTPFIRPKPNVMQPRNELRISSPASLARTSSSRTSSTQSPRSSQVPSTGAKTDEMNDRRQSNYSATASFRIPSRNSSLLSRRHDRMPSELIQLHLPRETAFADDHKHPALFPDLASLSLPAESFPPKETSGSSEGAQKGLLDPLPIYPASRVETPPPSNEDGFAFPSPPERGRKASAKLPQLQLTPEPSPGMIPQWDSPLSEPESSTEINKAMTCTPPSRRATTSSVPLLDDDWRESYVQSAEDAVSPKTTTVFHEYPVEDFLNMTDEDLAEVKVVHPSEPPSKRAPPPPILSPTSRSASLTSNIRSPVPTSPALASSQVAAWEAARIAKKYDFDVVYVANFRPSRMNHLHSPREPITYPASSPTSAFSSTHSSFTQSLPASMLSSPVSDRPAPSTHNSTPRHSFQSHSATASIQLPRADIFASSSPVSPAAPAIRDCCPNSGTPAGAARGLSGALLAAYGLETIQAPFRLSSTVHKKILRTEGWIEHRNSAAAANEFARGYARAFHTGGAAPTTPVMFRRSSAPDVSTATRVESGGGATRSSDKKKKKKQKQINRGIVFVAYRRSRGPGGAVDSSAAELDALEKEAETLVELILDFHKERRRWETLQERRRARES